MASEKQASSDRRVVRTKQAIHDAIYSLVQESHDLKLSVSEVAKRANINRKTFYAHYDTIDDALRALIDDEVTRLCGEMVVNMDEYDLRDITLVFLQLIDTNGFIGNKPYHHSNDLVHILSMVHAPIRRIVAEQNYFSLPLSEERLNLAISMYLSSLVVAYYEWNSGALPLTLEELADLVASYTLNGIAPYMHTK